MNRFIEQIAANRQIAKAHLLILAAAARTTSAYSRSTTILKGLASNIGGPVCVGINNHYRADAGEQLA